MKTLNQIIGKLTVALVLALSRVSSLHAQGIDSASDTIERQMLLWQKSLRQLEYATSKHDGTEEPYLIPLDELKLVEPFELPRFGTFWSRQLCTPPLPFNPFTDSYNDIHVDVYALPDGAFLLDDVDVDYMALYKQTRMAKASGGGFIAFGGETSPSTSMLRTFEQFVAQTFSVIDTNAVAITDPNLYGACISFPPDTNTAATLQIAKYGTNAVIIKANHFDYSAETERDFALLICDSVDKPLWKNIDFSGASDSQDGWLIQGSVPRHLVTNPMFLLISNITRADNAFFRAIAYGGPQIQLTGPQANNTVSNTITLHATIIDLSGVTNVQFALNVDGAPARYSFGTNNTISLETKYNPNGIANIYLNAFSKPRIYDAGNPPDNSKLFFSGIGALPLDFENDTYLAFASDYASPDIGTNHILYVIDKAQQIEARIFNPANNQTLASFAGYVPYPATVALPWKFTLADGVTPYTNDSYGVHFVAYYPTTLDITNRIDRAGVRTGAGCYLTYQEEDPFDLGYGPGNVYLNDQANTWIKGALKTLYQDLYKPLSLTQYTTSQVGTNRNHSDCTAQDLSNVEWALFLRPAMSNSIYSDLTIAQAHGNGIEIGGGPFFLNRFSSYQLNAWIMSYQPRQSWRLRKAAIWTCYSGSVVQETGNLGFPQACGIRDERLQVRSYMRKNCGLFFGGKIDQAWAQGGEVITTARAAAFLDNIWVCGKFPWPGACDPTYSFRWAVQRTLIEYNQVRLAEPRLFGYSKMIYSSIFDDELMVLDPTHVKEN